MGGQQRGRDLPASMEMTAGHGSNYRVHDGRHAVRGTRLSREGGAGSHS
jgi:hypothetical protein